MSCKELTVCVLRNIAGCALSALAIVCWPDSTPVLAGETNSISPKFLGAQTCSTSSCHGGAGNKDNQFTIWARDDFHHERPFALLETRRSAVIAESLKISDPTRDARCTVCHAPFHTVPPEQLGPQARVIEGVSCESCHGPAENWLRPHTRKDWTSQDRVSAGMRDLRNLYVRANTCVACHQNVEPDLRRAGHPELIFELDGQDAAEPRHWQKSADNPGPQIWLVGQAVASREIGWQLSRGATADENLRGQWESLLWVLQPISQVESRLPAFNADFYSAKGDDLHRVQQWCDDFAKKAARLVWCEDLTRRCLASLADTSTAFTASNLPPRIHARRAERLVLALDRLVSGLDKWSAKPELNQALDHLFADVQSMPDFNPNQFAKHLNEFQAKLADVAK